MQQIPVSNLSGFIFKKPSLERVGIKIDFLALMLELGILHENDNLVSFQPCYPDRVQYLIAELKKINLEYFEDYFLLEIDLPEWISLYADLKV